MSVSGEGEELELTEGDHVTLVDVITDAVAKPMRRQPGKRQRMYLRVTLGNRRPEVTATFFNADYLIKDLVPGTRLMMSGGRSNSSARQCSWTIRPSWSWTPPSGRTIGTKSLKSIADASAGGMTCWRPSSVTSSRSIPRRRKCRAGMSTVRAPGA